MKYVKFAISFIFIAMLSACGSKFGYKSEYDANFEEDSPIEIQKKYYETVGSEIKNREKIVNAVTPAFSALAESVGKEIVPEKIITDREKYIAVGNSKQFDLTAKFPPVNVEKIMKERTKQIEIIANAITKSVSNLRTNVAAPKKFVFEPEKIESAAIKAEENKEIEEEMSENEVIDALPEMQAAAEAAVDGNETNIPNINEIDEKIENALKAQGVEPKPNPD